MWVARFILSLLRELTYLDRDAMDYFRAMAAAGEESHHPGEWDVRRTR
jgi:hypothetical protein